ncbi:hypothetical protein [Azotosporobacter soli]|uniref:hypothetical protein n=1 Tax=Azotosporobacter soli TaxID=3055040 RepID=UPI0031FF2B2F
MGTKRFWQRIFALGVMTGFLMFNSQMANAVVDNLQALLRDESTTSTIAAYKNRNTGAVSWVWNPSNGWLQDMSGRNVAMSVSSLNNAMSQANQLNCQNNTGSALAVVVAPFYSSAGTTPLSNSGGFISTGGGAVDAATYANEIYKRYFGSAGGNGTPPPPTTSTAMATTPTTAPHNNDLELFIPQNIQNASDKSKLMSNQPVTISPGLMVYPNHL